MNCEGDMCVKDSSFMLFGKKIPVPECHIPVPECHIPVPECQIQANSSTMNSCSNSSHKGIEMPHTQNIEKPKNSSKEESESKVNTSTVEDTDQDKVLKKPDKILQCARCKSFDTKFCYFNNYNVNQPRHFCRNCHRYWTAGGTMRNVPVGAGRRKNKHIASQYRHMIVASDGIPTANLETIDSSRYQHVSTTESDAIFRCSNNGIVLKFGQDNAAALHESNDSVFNPNFEASGNNCRENGDEESSLCVSSVTNGYTRGNELSESEQTHLTLATTQNRLKPMQNYPAPSWIIPLNQGWNNVASTVQSSMQMCNPYGIDPNGMQWCHAPMVAVTNIGLQFVPGSYRNGTPLCGGGNGNVSIGSNGCVSPSSSTTSNSFH